MTVTMVTPNRAAVTVTLFHEDKHHNPTALHVLLPIALHLPSAVQNAVMQHPWIVQTSCLTIPYCCTTGKSELWTDQWPPSCIECHV